MDTSTAVQFDSGSGSGKSWVDMLELPDPFGGEDEIEKFTIYVSKTNTDFIDRVCAFLNNLNQVEGKKVRRTHKRKRYAESALAAQLSAMKAQLAPMIEACGSLPDPEDKVGGKAYAKKVVAWSKKQDK